MRLHPALAAIVLCFGCTTEDATSPDDTATGSPPSAQPPPNQPGSGQLPGGPFVKGAIRFEIDGTATEYELPNGAVCSKNNGKEFKLILSPGTSPEPGDQAIDLSMPWSAVSDEWDTGSAASVTVSEGQDSSFEWRHVIEVNGRDDVRSEGLVVHDRKRLPGDPRDAAVGSCTVDVSRPDDGAFFSTTLDVLITCTDVMYEDDRTGTEILKTAQTTVVKTQCSFLTASY